jgi:hypothetical protein
MNSAHPVMLAMLRLHLSSDFSFTTPSSSFSMTHSDQLYEDILDGLSSADLSS